MPATVPLTLAVGAATDVGLARELNEDSLLVRGTLFAVADGMGGHAAGEIASALAVAELDGLTRVPEVTADDILAAVERANRAIVARAAADPDVLGMGTTLTGLCLGTVGGTPHWFVFNVGDSRVYRVDGSDAVQLTVDHSEVAELLAAGVVTRAEAAVHPLRNVVTRSLGTEPTPLVDLWVLPAEGGDVFVLCSDGLTNEVDDVAIAAAVTGAGTPQQACDSLIRDALRHGGRDNVTVVVVSATLPADALEPAAAVTAPRPRKAPAP